MTGGKHSPPFLDKHPFLLLPLLFFHIFTSSPKGHDRAEIQGFARPIGSNRMTARVSNKLLLSHRLINPSSSAAILIAPPFSRLRHRAPRLQLISSLAPPQHLGLRAHHGQFLCRLNRAFARIQAPLRALERRNSPCPLLPFSPTGAATIADRVRPLSRPPSPRLPSPHPREAPAIRRGCRSSLIPLLCRRLLGPRQPRPMARVPRAGVTFRPTSTRTKRTSPSPRPASMRPRPRRPTWPCRPLSRRITCGLTRARKNAIETLPLPRNRTPLSRPSRLRVPNVLMANRPNRTRRSDDRLGRDF